MADVFLHQRPGAHREPEETPAPGLLRRGAGWLRRHGMEIFIAAVIVAGLFGPWIVSAILIGICGLCYLMAGAER